MKVSFALSLPVASLVFICHCVSAGVYKENKMILPSVVWLLHVFPELQLLHVYVS